MDGTILENIILIQNYLFYPLFFEGFGNVLIEALSYGLPCISTNTDGPKEILENGKFGLLIKNNHPKLSQKYN